MSKVNPNAIATTVIMAAHFASTISSSVIGSVNNVSIVFVLFSSAKAFMVRAGIKISIIHGVIAKKGFIEADPIANRSFTKRKFAHIPNSTIVIYPIGLVR